MRETLLGVEFFSVPYAASSSLPGVIGEHHAELLVHGVGGLAKHHLMSHSDCLEEDELLDAEPVALGEQAPGGCEPVTTSDYPGSLVHQNL